MTSSAHGFSISISWASVISASIVSGFVAAADRIVLHSEQSAEWIRLGLLFTPDLLTPGAGADLEGLLAAVEDADEVEVVLNDSPIQVEVERALDEGETAGRCYDVLVRVLGRSRSRAWPSTSPMPR